MTRATIQIEFDGSTAASNFTQTSQFVPQKYKCSMSKQHTAVVKFQSSAEYPPPVSNLIINFLENMPRFVHLFFAESAPASNQKFHSHIDWTPSIASDSDGLVRE